MLWISTTSNLNTSGKQFMNFSPFPFFLFAIFDFLCIIMESPKGGSILYFLGGTP